MAGYDQYFLSRTAGLINGAPESAGFVAELNGGVRDEVVILQIAGSPEDFLKNDS